MPDFVRVRAIQVLMGCLYTILAAISLIIIPSWILLLFSGACALGAYITGITLDDFIIPRHAIFRVCGLGLTVAILDAFLLARGMSKTADMSAIAMSYCAGNRFRAAGLLRRR
jgi:hypothetical protein